MEEITLGKVLGMCLSDRSGLSYVHIPYGINAAHAEDIVTVANDQVQIQKDGLPFAVLVDDKTSGTINTPLIRISQRDTIRYRQNNHLIVLKTRQPDLASFHGVFVPLMSPGYPLNAGGVISIENVARRYVQCLFTDRGFSDPVVERTAAEHLQFCLELLSDIYQSEDSGVRPWNALWFEHVSRGFLSLEHEFDRVGQSDPSMSRASFFDRYTAASFGLPINSYSARLDSRKFTSAWEEHWADEAGIVSSIRKLAHHPEIISSRLPHPLESVSFSEFGVTTSISGSTFSAFSRIISDSEGGIDAVAHLTVAQFLTPDGVGKDAYLKVFSDEGQLLQLRDASPSEPFLIPLVPDGSFLRSDMISVEVPTISLPSLEAVSSSKIRLVLSGKTYGWEGDFRLDDKGRLFAVGRFYRKYSQRNPKQKFSHIVMSVEMPVEDPLAGFLNHSSARICFYPRGTAFAVYGSVASGGSRYKYLGPENMMEFPPESQVEYFADIAEGRNSSYRVGIVNARFNEGGVAYNGAALPAGATIGGLSSVTLAPSGWDQFQTSEATYVFRVADAKGKQSPLHAAIHGRVIDKDLPDVRLLESFRGVLEAFYSKRSMDRSLERGLGHLFLPADMPADIDSTVAVSDGLALIPQGAAEIWNQTNLFELPKGFDDGPEAERFRTAFRSLGLGEMVSSLDKSGSEYLEMMSKLSYAELLDGDKVTEYLEAYQDLIAAAVETGSPSAIFWASYPMSVSVWGTSVRYGCQGILLSPWHPIRLAWLAQTERTLRTAANASDLAGLVEGWNFPYIGPQESLNSRVIAVPMDPGEDQLFLGWSLMVPVTTDRYDTVTVPERAAGLDLPGTALSGLNGRAAADALSSYKAMKPHLSTLSVDLAAQERTPRLGEIDTAVLEIAKSWRKGSGDGRLLGGVRVWDSLNRTGDVPTDEVRSLVRADPELLITWSRYVPRPLDSRSSNVRFLQDIGARMQVSRSESDTGAIGPIPLRRFFGRLAPGDEGRASVANPYLVVADTSFARSVCAIEGVYGNPQVSSRIFNTALGDGKADWTISGESMLGPAAIATLLDSPRARSEDRHMLWEWSPPIFKRQGTDIGLERRPFLSVAKVPPSFEVQIQESLSRVSPLEAEAKSKQLVSTLGARGVGLSNLLARGGTHVAGAIGFYAAFNMLSNLPDDSSDDYFIIPLDAAHSFLNLLAGGKQATSYTQRADLLIIRVDDDSVTLSPVEIKCYGLTTTSPARRLPKVDSSVIKDAAEQVHAAISLLQQMCDEFRSAIERGESDKLLWANALTALVETGARLQPTTEGLYEPVRLARRLAKSAAGDMRLKTGKPAILFFQDTQGSESAFYADYRDDPATGTGTLGTFVTDLSLALATEPGSTSRFNEEVRRLIRWSCGGLDTSIDPSAEMAELNRTAGSPMPLHSTSENNSSAVAHDKSLVLQDSESTNGPADPSVSTAKIEGEGVKFFVGDLLDSVGKSKAVYWPSNTDLTQMNLGVVGDLGTGKTEFLKAYITQMRSCSSATQEDPVGFLVFDYKGDFQDPDFLQRVGGEVIMPRNIPLNVFALVTEDHNRQPYQQAAAFIDVLRRIYTGVGVVQAENLNEVIRALFSASGGMPPTLHEVRDAYADVISKPDSILSILNSFVYGGIFSGDASTMQSFADLTQGRVIVLALDKLGTDQHMKNALVALFLNLYYEYMIRSEKTGFVGTDPQLRQLKSFLVVDEAVNIMAYEFPVMMNLMLQARQFGIGVVLASQFLSHFRTGAVNYGQPLSSWLIHKVPSVTNKELEQLGLRSLAPGVAARITTLGKHEALYKSFGHEAGSFVRATPYYEL